MIQCYRTLYPTGSGRILPCSDLLCSNLAPAGFESRCYDTGTCTRARVSVCTAQ
jgi:hypothetical protein